VLFSLPIPFISSAVQSKLAIRAILLNDSILLKSLIDDIDRVCSVRKELDDESAETNFDSLLQVHIRRDLPKSLTAIHYAIQNNAVDLLQILLEDFKKPKHNRCDFPKVTMKQQETGQ
jgi:hypothetical protein